MRHYHAITVMAVVDTDTNEHALYVGPEHWGENRVATGGIKLSEQTAREIVSRLPDDYLSFLFESKYRK